MPELVPVTTAMSMGAAFEQGRARKAIRLSVSGEGRCRIPRRSLLPEGEELLARHRVDAANGQRAAPDRPVARGELSGALEVAFGRVEVAGAVQVPGEAPFGPGLLLLARRKQLVRADLIWR